MRLPSDLIKWVLGATAIVAVVLVVRSYVGAKDAEWQTRVEVVQAQSRENLAIGDSLREEAAELRGLATSLAFAAEQRDTVVIRMVEQLPAPPPDCEPFTLPRDSVIIALQEQYGLATAAYRTERSASDQLRLAEAKARESSDSLLAVLADRPKPLSPLIPEIGVGLFAGLCTTGQPCAGVGVGFQWKVRMF